jgi:hypothetical protein
MSNVMLHGLQEHHEMSFERQWNDASIESLSVLRSLISRRSFADREHIEKIFFLWMLVETKSALRFVSNAFP